MRPLVTLEEVPPTFLRIHGLTQVKRRVDVMNDLQTSDLVHGVWYAGNAIIEVKCGDHRPRIYNELMEWAISTLAANGFDVSDYHPHHPGELPVLCDTFVGKPYMLPGTTSGRSSSGHPNFQNIGNMVNPR